MVDTKVDPAAKRSRLRGMPDYRCMSDSSSRGHDPSPVPYFRGGILKKSADENKSMINYPACNELTPFQPNCYELTPFQPKCFVLNAFILMSAADIQV